VRIVPASDSSVMVIFGDAISDASSDLVGQLFQGLLSLRDARVRNLHPAYASLLVDFDPLRIGHDEIVRIIEEMVARPLEMRESERRCVDIPVCYDSEFGPDLESVAKQVGLSVEEVARAHSSAKYVVGFLGFSPGFAYLEGLPSHLAAPRLATPRRRVEAGSVGIAGEQTGVYPVSSPGGWQIIGRTPTRMFDPKAEPPSLLQLGDEVRFVRISRDEFEIALTSIPNRRLA